MRSSRLRSFAAVFVLAVLAGLMPAQADVTDVEALDRAIFSRNILPPGQGRYLNTPELAIAQVTGEQPAMNTNQLQMYEDLVTKAPALSESDLATLFKDASFGVAPADVGRTYSPREDVTIVRDAAFEVPHVFGTTRAGTMFGNGYVSAEDRWFMMDTLRHVARGRLSEFLGASDANLAMDRAQRLVADYTEEELWHQALRLLDVDEELAYLALQDLTNFTAGINAYLDEMLLDPAKLPGEYPALQLVPQPWKVTDSIALSTLIGGTFSVGGGGQIRNDRFLDALENEHDPASARAIFDDFRNADDPEAPTNTSTPFPFNTPTTVDPASVARPDNAAEVAAAMEKAKMPPVIDGPFGPIRLGFPNAMSNALLVNADRSASGRPIAVMGPQVGYWSPEILMEIDMHGPGVHARGATFPGVSLYVLLGRGEDYAWSATTAVGDHIDMRAVKLCEPDGSAPTQQSTHYLADGVCTAMYTRTDRWLAKPSAGGVPGSPEPSRIVVEMTTERTHHGIVVARGTVDDEPVAFVRQRSSYLREVDATLTFAAIHDPARIDDIADLQHAFGDFFSFSFNWHLITGDDIGFITTGRYPVVADGVDQDLPYWGDSRWDWKRFLTFSEHPQEVNPPEGFITNWNNKQAPGFRASDDNYSYGSVQRKMLLADGINAALTSGDNKVSMTELVQAMGLAATQDLRGVKVLPHMIDIMGSGDTPAQTAAITALNDWSNAGAHRRDMDGNGQYEDATTVALMDELWSPALREVFGPELGIAFGAMPIGHSNGPGPGGSAFFGGWYSQMHKDLRSVLGLNPAGPYSRQYCGAGVVADCRAALLRALDTAVVAVAARDLSTEEENPWSKDAIRFSAVGVQEQRPMHWQNRPTFQQAVEFMPPA